MKKSAKIFCWKKEAMNIIIYICDLYYSIPICFAICKSEEQLEAAVEIILSSRLDSVI